MLHRVAQGAYGAAVGLVGAGKHQRHRGAGSVLRWIGLDVGEGDRNFGVSLTR